MQTRRKATAMIGAAALLMVPPRSVRHAWAQQGERAVTFVKSTSDKLVAIVNSSGMPQEKHLQLQTVIGSSVDADDIARSCLGRFMRLATPDERKQYMALFHDLLVTEIAGHLGEYQGVRVTMGLARASEDTEIVITTVERPNNPPTQIDWVIATNTGGPRIVDLLAEGTSLRLTQSADFAAFLARHQYKIQELIEGMRQRVARNE
jgi:phospholipid transport system substrate-binding protein